MKIKSLRWGYDGGGFACGPVEGNSIVELTAIDDAGNLVFTLGSSNGEGIDFKVSDMPLYDLMINLTDDDVDFEEVLGKAESHAISSFGAIWGDEVPEEMLESKYKPLLSVAFAALYHYMNTSTEDEVLPEEFLKEFVDEDGVITNIPEISFDDDDEDYED